MSQRGGRLAKSSSSDNKNPIFNDKQGSYLKPFLQGQKVYLRALESRDLEGPYLEWLHDPTVTRFMQAGLFPTPPDSLHHYVQNTAQASDAVMLAIVEKRTEDHIGNIKLSPIQWVHRRGEMGIMIGDKKYWGRGYGLNAVSLVLEYAFTRLNLNKITLGVEEGNKPAMKLYQRLGFKIEGLQRKQWFREGRYRDNVLMGLLRSEYKRVRKSGS